MRLTRKTKGTLAGAIVRLQPIVDTPTTLRAARFSDGSHATLPSYDLHHAAVDEGGEDQSDLQAKLQVAFAFSPRMG